MLICAIRKEKLQIRKLSTGPTLFSYFAFPVMFDDHEQFLAEPNVWRKGDKIFSRHFIKEVAGTKILCKGAIAKFRNKKTGKETIKLRFKSKWFPVPSMAEVERWTFDSVCETPDGEIVEHDHPDSWLHLLGLV